MAKRYTLQDFQDEYPDDAACLDRIMDLRYGDAPTCGECKRKTKYHRIAKRRAYACQFCGAHVYPCVGTPFEKSRTPLTKWFYAMCLFTTTRHGVAAKELERQLGVTYKCAWRIGHKIRKHMAIAEPTALYGEVEVDETYKLGQGRPDPRRKQRDKTIVVGVKQRGGSVKTQAIPNVKRRTLEPYVKANVRQGSVVHTDENMAYWRLPLTGYVHRTVNHRMREYVRGGVHTNSIEGYWSHLKRGIRGTHIAVSAKHLPKYLAEFEYRHNLRDHPDRMFPVLMEMLRPQPSV